MKFEQSRLISYSMSFISYLTKALGSDVKKIKGIYLFGSVARGDFRKDSDIDIFIETAKTNHPISKQINKIKESYFKTIWYKSWKGYGIKNEINIIVGKLSEWKIKSSIESHGIILFSNYTPKKYDKKFIITWKSPKKPKKRVTLHRKIFGYWGKEKKYKGLLKDEERISSNTIIIKETKPILNIFNKLKIRYEIREVYLRI